MRRDTPSVLIVEDDQAIRHLIETILEDAGCETTTAGDGVAGLVELDRHAVDVVVLDLRMPVMDGARFHREMRRRGCAVPTILVSSDPHAPAIARELGIDAWISKPFDVDRLVEAVFELT